jgi:hypothetical protein
MNKLEPLEKIIHPKDLLIEAKKGDNLVKQFNTGFALIITKSVGTMWTAYIFTLLALFSLPAVLVGVFPGMASSFPTWLLKTSLIALVAWIAQTFLQLVLLPIIMVGQNTIQAQNDAKAQADHDNLLMLVKLQVEQMSELKNQSEILGYLKENIRS